MYKNDDYFKIRENSWRLFYNISVYKYIQFEKYT